MKYIGFIIAVVLAVSCSSGKRIPDGIIKPDAMGNILFDAGMAEEFVMSYVAKDSAKNKDVELQKEYQKIYLLYNVTEEQFKKSYTFYKAHTDIFKVLMDSLNARAQRRRTEMYRMPG
ncbi:MAG: DUF4296 domain-containing protein [Chitinophagaceae bacterium]|nr:DUF4296 domain-containing protein [Chitinophagaceae bacterium]